MAFPLRQGRAGGNYKGGGTKFPLVPEGWEGAEPSGPGFSQILDPLPALEGHICPGASARKVDKVRERTKFKMHLWP